MSVLKRYHLWITAVYSVFFTLALFVLDPFVFISDDTLWVSLSVVFVVSLVLCWSLLKVSFKSFSSPLVHVIIVLGLFGISVTSGALVVLLNNSVEVDLLLYYNSFLILPILPASVYILWLMYDDLSKRVVVSTENQSTEHSIQKLFRIQNNRNQTILECPIEHIIAFEANDNYVNTYYLNAESKVDKVLHRISLKKITELLDQIDIEFYRVHKSYLINPDFVQKLNGKSQSYRIKMNHLPIEVPVSRTFDVTLIHMSEA